MALLSLPATAQVWQQANPAPPPLPSVRNRAAMAYDAARGLSMLFGGDNGWVMPLGDFWAFNGTTWQQLGGVLPAARWGHGMVYDTRRERLVLFGGFRPSPGNPLPDAIGLDETWEYDGSVWTQRPTTTQPSPRGDFGMAYDPIRQRSLLFGGVGPNTTYLQDTWEWDGVAWTQVNAPVQPSSRRGPAMAYDLERAEVVLFGGGALGTQFGDTWVYDGTTWTQRTPVTSPPARWESTMVFDPLCGRTLLQGGATFSYQTIFGDSWDWDGGNWTQVAGTQPSARRGVAATFDLKAGRSLWFSGRHSAGFRSDLWGWSGGCLRTMSTVTPAAVGQTAKYRYHYPPTARNNVYLELWTLRSPNALLLPIPGFVAAGLTRVDVFSILLQTAGVLGVSDQQDTLPFAVPNSPAVVGFTFDVQDLDLDLDSSFLYWSSNDIEATVAAAPPIAAFTAAPTSGACPLVVQFTNASQFATSWQWDFQGDSAIDSTQQHPSFTYTTPGTYTVRLVATGPGGASTQTQAGSIDVYEGPSFTATPFFGLPPLVVQFAGSATFPVTSWNWDFENDGVIDATAQNPSFTYTSAGTYMVRLVVTTTTAPFTRVLVRPAVFVGPSGLLDPALNMVPIQPGTFQMGSNATTSWPYFSTSVERPVHTVTITRPFWMGRHEVTQAQYQAVMGSNPSYFQGASWPNAVDRPVDSVTWFGAVAYCDALTAQEAAAGRLPEGYEYRLPTEAEWEYCCRAGTTTEYHYGASLACVQANFTYSYFSGGFCPTTVGGETAVVGSYAPNAWGLHDMHGNVWEWCLDRWYGIANYPVGPISDPYVVGGNYRIIRGAGNESNSGQCRSASRSGDGPTSFTYGRYGFRVVCAPVLP